jgi:hypothetical protein
MYDFTGLWVPGQRSGRDFVNLQDLQNLNSTHYQAMIIDAALSSISTENT